MTKREIAGEVGCGILMVGVFALPWVIGFLHPTLVILR